MVKLKNIAEHLGIGISTVSAVLNDKEHCYVSEAKKELIKKTALEMGYVPNRMSQGIKGLPTNTIGVIGALLSVPATSHMINHINSRIYESNYTAMLGDSRFEVPREKFLINEFLSRGVDGFLFQSCMSADELKKTINGHVPYVGFNQETAGANVTMSRKAGVFMMVEHLIAKHGHRRIGFVTTSMPANQDKLSGYKSALDKNDIPAEEENGIEIPSITDTAKAVDGILSRKLTAVFCSNDIIAGHLIRSLLVRGVRIPEDVAVVGFDGLDFICEMTLPSLTSVRQPFEEISQLAVSLLMRKLKGEEVDDKTYFLEPLLRIGESCGCRGNNK